MLYASDDPAKRRDEYLRSPAACASSKSSCPESVPLIFRDFQPESQLLLQDARVSLGTRNASRMTPAKALPRCAPKNGQSSRARAHNSSLAPLGHCGARVRASRPIALWTRHTHRPHPARPEICSWCPSRVVTTTPRRPRVTPQLAIESGWMDVPRDCYAQRTVTWGKFKIRSTGDEFWFFNTHLPHNAAPPRIVTPTRELRASW